VCVRVLGEYHPPPSPPTPGKEEVPARRGSDGKLRGRKRVSDPAPPLDADMEVNTHSHSVEHYQNLSLTHTHTRTRTRINVHEVNITSLLFHCSVCLSGTWMKPSSFSIRSSREPSPRDLARYADATPPVAIYCQAFVPELITRVHHCIIRTANGAKAPATTI